MYRNSCCQPQPMNNMKPACSMYDDMALAMAYVPIQHFQNTYDLQTALVVGTIFPELNKPFKGYAGGVKCNR